MIDAQSSDGATLSLYTLLNTLIKGSSPGLVVKGGARNQKVVILNPVPDTGWTFFTLICCKIVMFV